MKIFAALVANAVFAADTCQDVKNWGTSTSSNACSYQCDTTTDLCICPSHWELVPKNEMVGAYTADDMPLGGTVYAGQAASGLDCRPQASAITVTCSNTQIAVDFRPELFNMDVATALTKVKIGTCNFGEKMVHDGSSATVRMTMQLSDCGMDIGVEPNTNAFIVWSADMVSEAETSGVIQNPSKPSRSIKVGCQMYRYGEQVTITAVQGPNLEQNEVTDETRGSVSLTYSLDAYSDAARTTEALEFNSGETIYFKAQRSSAPIGTEVFLTSCSVTDQSPVQTGQTAQTFRVIDKCVTSQNAQAQAIKADYLDVPATVVGTEVEFQYNSFLFDGAENGANQLVTCKFRNCVTGANCVDELTNVCPTLAD